MKKVKRTAVIIAFMFGALNATASEGKLSLLTNSESKSIVFESDSWAGETKIKLFDSDRNVIYYENIGRSAYVKKFDLNNLKDGIYYFTADDLLKTLTYTIKLNQLNVLILDKKEETKPVFKKKDDMVYLNLLNLDKQDVEIEIFDGSNRSVFFEKLKDTAIIEKAFNFKKAFEDSYTLVIKDGSNTYYETITIEK